MKISCIGSGVYAQGLCKNLVQIKNNSIIIWTHDKDNISNLKENFDYPNLNFTANINDIEDSDIVIIATSSSFLTKMIQDITPIVSAHAKIYIGTKGILEQETYLEYANKYLLQNKIYTFAGPTLAKDLLNLQPMGITISTDDQGTFSKLFPDYSKFDIADNSQTLEIFTAYKNIVAIGSGMIYSFTNSTSSMLFYLTKCLKEIKENLKLNENIITYGIVGDFYLTGTTKESRNFTFGTLLANSSNDEWSLFLEQNTVEGVSLLQTLQIYLESKNVTLPIITVLSQIINLEVEPQQILEYLKVD